MTTQPPDTVAAEKIAKTWASRPNGLRTSSAEFDAYALSVAYIDLLAQLTAANERADRATAEAAVLLADMRGSQYQRYLTDEWVERVSPLAAAHLSEYRRLVEGQRTPGLDEKCPHCGAEFETGFSGCSAYADDEAKKHCPAIRAGVKP